MDLVPRRPRRGDRTARRWAVGQARRQLDAAEAAFGALYAPERR